MYETTTNRSAPFSQMVGPSEHGNRLNRLWCSCHIISRIAKVTANTGRPFMTWSSASNESGTASETTSSVMAKPNTASLNASMRVTSCSAVAAIAADSSACAPRTQRTRAARTLSTSNSQPPTSKELPIPNAQERLWLVEVDGWRSLELEVPWKLEVGNWKFARA